MDISVSYTHLYEPPPDEIDRLHENRHGRCLKKLAEIEGIVTISDILGALVGSVSSGPSADIIIREEIDRLHENRHGRCLKKLAEIAGIVLPHNALPFFQPLQ